VGPKPTLQVNLEAYKPSLYRGKSRNENAKGNGKIPGEVTKIRKHGYCQKNKICEGRGEAATVQEVTGRDGGAIVKGQCSGSTRQKVIRALAKEKFTQMTKDLWQTWLGGGKTLQLIDKGRA